MGKVYLIGAGPGASDLITLRAAELLRRADIVFHDALVHPGTVALAVKAETVAVGKRCGRYSTVQRFIDKRLIDAATKFDTVVRLKGGDPMLFGRAQEEIDALLKAGVEVEVVPGVSSALATSAELVLLCEVYRQAVTAQQPALYEQGEDNFIEYGNSWFR